jgi:acyl-CoA hydrolase
VRLGEIVEVVARVHSVGRSSMTVRVSLRRETQPGGEQVEASSGEFVMIAVDADGRPTAIAGRREEVVCLWTSKRLRFDTLTVPA